MKRFLINLAKATGIYLLVVMGGTVVFMTFLSVIGYVPYSDRPGPGWYGWQGIAAMKSGLFFLSWAALGMVPGAITGALLFISVQMLQWIYTPRWLIAMLGALASGFVSLVLVHAVGWYIAIGAVPVYGAGILGSIYGAWLLPKQVVQVETSADLGRWQKLAIFGIWCLTVAWVAHPFVPGPWHDPGQALEVIFVQLRPGPELLSAGKGLSEEESAYLNSLGVRGQLTANASFSGCRGEGCGREKKKARAVIIMQHPPDSTVTLLQPADRSSVIYLQEPTGWRRLPPDTPTSKRTIRLKVADNARDRIVFEADGMDASRFYWLEPSR